MILAIIIFAVALIIGIPIAVALALFGLIHILTMDNPAFTNVLVQRMFSGVNVLSLSCIPFFILAGELMNSGGVTKRLLDFFREMIGRVHGGLAYCTVGISAILAAILGSSQAVASLLCRVLVGELEKDSYKPEFSGALIASASVLGPIIPPSTMFIFYCMLTNVSVKYMFVAGIIPGIILALAYAVVVFFKTRKMNLKRFDDHPFSVKTLGKAFISAIPALMIPVIILGGILSGTFTATESGAVACVAAFIGGLIYKELKFKNLPAMFLRVAISTGSIFLIVAFGNIIAWSMTMDGIPKIVIQFIMGITDSPAFIVALILVILALVGCVLDMASATLIFIPVLFPLSLMIGMDSVHFGIIFSMMITIGMITPPVGQVLFVTTNVSGIPFMKIVSQIGWFVVASFAVTTLLAYLPDLVMWIPKLQGYTG
jgi:tripartite ATP-independent transporter DctM subunit